ncbi:MAG: anhydro-N-acetylmuramic acid kinase [Cycloclasticus sp.]
MSPLYIGLMSGTSLDGVDTAIVNFEQQTPSLVASHYQRYPEELLQAIKRSCQQSSINIEEFGQLDARLGDFYADCIQRTLSKNKLSANDISAIGSHGQTIHHSPNSEWPFSLQIGDPNRIAEKTNITVVADFRRRDIAAGGQGAPLVPAFHQQLFHSNSETLAVINIGGISNISYLNKDPASPLIGFDCGPGNTLMDQWCQQHLSCRYDEGGQLASQGQTNTALLQSLLSDPYFSAAHPKSTGPEYFNLAWLQPHLEQHPCSINDTLSTLCELSADCIALSCRQLGDIERVLLCGGGVHNQYLRQCLEQRLEVPLATTKLHGIDPDYLEAIAFAWLAKQTIEGKPGNAPSVTGANKALILGGIYPA